VQGAVYMHTRERAKSAQDKKGEVFLPQFPRVVLVLLTLLIYFLLGRVSLRFALVHPSVTALWLPTGATLAAFLLLGYRIWPGIFFGAFLVNLTTAGSVATSIGIALGNTLEGAVGAYLVNRYAQGCKAFDRTQDVFKFAFLAGAISTVVSATFGVTSLCLGGFAHWRSYGLIWLTWWLGDGVSDLVVAPLVVLWRRGSRLQWSRVRIAEALVVLALIVVIGCVVFGPSFRGGNYPLEFLCIPLLVWAAFRFGEREAALAAFVLSGIAIWGTPHGFSPFASAMRVDSLLLLDLFLAVLALMGLVLAAATTERNRAQEEIQRQASSDPLTGLANYRCLYEVFNREAERSGRTGRPVALLLLDLDGLKKINDAHGHLVGSRALCRLARVLQQECRLNDTPARYGGDEFAVIVPETEVGDAGNLAWRVAERLANDVEQPPLSFSFGVASYPQDGSTFDQVLRKADSSLYEMKRPRIRVRASSV